MTNTRKLSSPKIIGICKQRRYLIKTNRSFRPQAQLEQSLNKVEAFFNAYPKITNDNVVAYIKRNKSDFLLIIPTNQTKLRDWIEKI
jgi:hypothetical protein